ncbi:MAG: hypothetical protein LQ347_002647, partial [Umbilicaria vellea]
MPPPYTPSQKNAIAQFVSFTHAKDSIAARHLKSHAWNASRSKDDTPDAYQDWKDHEDDTREERLHEERARLDRKLAQNHLSCGMETILDNDTEENSLMLLSLGDTASFQYDLGDYMHDDPELSLDPLHSRELSMAGIQDLFLALCSKAMDPTSWVDPQRLPSMFRFALRRPLMPPEELHDKLKGVGIDPSLGFLEQSSNTADGSLQRSRELLKGILPSGEARPHVSSRHRSLPKGLSLLTSKIRDVDGPGPAENEPTDQDEMIAVLWSVYNDVESHEIRLEDAPMRYRGVLSAVDCSNEELAAWLERFEIPSDHIEHSSHRAQLSTGPSSPRVATNTMLLEEVAGLVQLHRSEGIQLGDFLSLLSEMMPGSNFNEDQIMGYVRDSNFDAEEVADTLLAEYDSPSSSGNESPTAALEELHRSPIPTSTLQKSALGDIIKQDLKEKFAAVLQDVVCSHIPSDHALSLFRELLGDPEMSNTMLSKNLWAYGVPPDLFFEGENLDEIPPKLAGNVEEAQTTRSKKPRITLKVPARPLSPTSSKDVHPTSAASSSVSTHCGTADYIVNEEEVHDDYNAAPETQAATAPHVILSSSPGKSTTPASSESIIAAEQKYQETTAKQQPEQIRNDNTGQNVVTSWSTQKTLPMRHEKSAKFQDSVLASTSTDPADPQPESETTGIAVSVERPTFVQPLPCHRPQKSKRSRKAKLNPRRSRAGTPMPHASMPVSVLSRSRRESVGIAWKRWVGASVGNPRDEFYDPSRLSVSPEKGTSVDLFGLPIPTKRARELAKTMNLPPDFADARIRSRTPRRVKSQKLEKAVSNVTLPSPKRKSSTPLEAGHRKMRKHEVAESEESGVFAAEGQDHDDFIRSLFTPRILDESGLACGWCLGEECHCGRTKKAKKKKKKRKASKMKRDTRPMLLEQPSSPFARIKPIDTTDPTQYPAERPSTACISRALGIDEASDTALALASITTKYQITLDTLTAVDEKCKSNVRSERRLPASDEANLRGTEYVEYSTQDNCVPMNGAYSMTETTDERSDGRARDTAQSPTPKLTSREFSPPPTTRYKVVDDFGLISPVSRGAPFSSTPVGLGLVDQSDQEEAADQEPDDLMTPLSRCPSSICRPAQLEAPTQVEPEDTAMSDEKMHALSRCPSSLSRSAQLEPPTQVESEDAAMADELMQPLSRCPSSLSRSAHMKTSTQVESEDAAMVDELMQPLSRCASRSSDSALLDLPTQTEGKVTAVSHGLTPSLLPCLPPTPRPQVRELPSKVFDSSESTDDRQAEQVGSDNLHRRRASLRVDSGTGTPLIRAKDLKAQRRRYKLFARERKRDRMNKMSYSELLDRALEKGRRAHKSYFVVMAELRHRRIEANLRARQTRFFQSSNNLSGPSGQTVALSKLFDKYREEAAESPDTIGVEGSMKYLGDLAVNLDEVVVLSVLAELQAPTMGEFSREGFIQGWKTYSADTLSKQQALIPQFRRHLLTHPDFFKRTYKHTFLIARSPGQKSVALDTAIEYWRLLFCAPGLAWHSPTTPWMEWWTEFLEARWNKSVNRDMWDQTGVFVGRCLADESMGWWSEDGAWPGVLDEF